MPERMKGDFSVILLCFSFNFSFVARLKLTDFAKTENTCKNTRPNLVGLRVNMKSGQVTSLKINYCYGLVGERKLEPSPTLIGIV